jgi:hypothetical protein
MKKAIYLITAPTNKILLLVEKADVKNEANFLLWLQEEANKEFDSTELRKVKNHDFAWKIIAKIKNRNVCVRRIDLLCTSGKPKTVRFKRIEERWL